VEKIKFGRRGGRIRALLWGLSFMGNTIDLPIPSRELKPGVSLCMIVRDAANTLHSCLRSIRPWVNEIIVVDTGSVDGTPELASQYDVKLFHFLWRDDFSVARNESLCYAQHQWLFWMDADDVIDEKNGRKLQGLIEQQISDHILGFVLQVQCPGARPDDLTVVDHVKVFRNQPDLRFEGRIHEQILPSIRRAGGDVLFTDIFVVHAGADQSPEGRRRKHARDLRLLMLEAADRPNHPFTLFNLGMTYLDAGMHAEAVIALEASRVFSVTTESHVRKLYALLAAGYLGLGRDQQALAICREGLRIYPEDVELLFRLGVIAHRNHNLEEARDAYVRLLQGKSDRVFSSCDSALNGYKAKYNLGCVYQDMGRLEDAELVLRESIQEQPTFSPAVYALIDILLAEQKLEDASRTLEEVSEALSESDVLILKSRIAVVQGNSSQVQTALNEYIASHPDDIAVLRELCSLLFSSGDFTAAETALSRLVELANDDASAFHNLGLVRFHLGRSADAVEPLQRAMALRPNWPATEELLAACNRSKGGH